MGATKREFSSSLYSDERKGSWFRCMCACVCLCVSQAEQFVQPVLPTVGRYVLYSTVVDPRETVVALGGSGPLLLSISIGDREELGTLDLRPPCLSMKGRAPCLVAHLLLGQSRPQRQNFNRVSHG